MRAGNCQWRLSSSGVAALAVMAMGTIAFGVPKAELKPINNGLSRSVDAPVIAGAVLGANSIALTAGGVNVEIEIYGSDWGSVNCVSEGGAACRLGAIQVAMDRESYYGANAAPAQAGVDLTPFGGNNSPLGGFIVSSVCPTTGRDCGNSQPNPGCTGEGGFCVPNPRIVTASCNPQPVLALFASGTNGLNYEFGSVCQTGSAASITPAQAQANGYVGTVILQVPGAAATTYTVKSLRGFCKAPNNTTPCVSETDCPNNIPGDPVDYCERNFTFFNDAVGLTIGEFVNVDATIQIVTGSCCRNLGDLPVVCTDNVTAAQCQALPSSNARIFRAGQPCPPPDNSGPNFCPACTTPSDPACRDPIAGQAGNDNLCTSQVCQNFVCSYTDLYNVGFECCNPDVGPSSVVIIDDGDPCTADVCNPVTGQVSHTGTTGNACDDDRDCTTADACDAGACVGVDINTITCSVDADCPLGTCGTAVPGFCECSELTPLCVEPQLGVYTDTNCFDAGDTVNAVILIGPGSQVVTGGQFNMTYDPICLDFVSIGPCPVDTIYTNVIETDVDEAAGTIFYAVTNDPTTQANEGSAGPYALACMTFTKLSDCDACSVCFADVNPRNNILTNDDGNRVPIDLCGCSKAIRTAGEITLNTPAGASVNADCGQAFATVNWATASASDSCDGPLTLECAAQHVGGQAIGGLIATGGIFPQGKSFFTCTASNSCGKSETDVWTVMVSDNQTLDVEVHLQPQINNAGVFNRAITFTLYNDCVSDPVVECAVISFQGPYNFPGHGRATLKVDKGNFLCMTAQDMLHTLRSIVTGDDLSCVNNHWTAVFKGDPIQGGNWLIGGNLDAWKADATYGDVNTINILDFGMFMAELAAGASYEPNGDTTCLTPGPHGDINADGAVDAGDYAFIVDNFLKHSKDLCCPAPAGPGAEFNPLTSVTVKELRRMGYGNAVIADLDRNGTVDLDDMAAFMQGAQPIQAKPVREDVKGRGTR